MATKPNETYKWGENATHEQVAAYEDTGWPSDIIPPKRTQFNWYQNLIGRWLGWAEDAVDEIVDTVVDHWFVEINLGSHPWGDISSVPHANGFYIVKGADDGDYEMYCAVVGDTMLRYDRYGIIGINFNVKQYRYTGGSWVSDFDFTRSNTRTAILQESESSYVTPKGLVDYFSVTGAQPVTQFDVPHQTGVYFIGDGAAPGGVSIVTGDRQVIIPLDSSINGTAYDWDGSAWVLQS